MIKQYRRKPIVLEAVQYDGHNYQEIAGFVGEKCRVSRKMNDPIYIDTLEGMMTAQVGDWIVKGVLGEFWPVKPDVFERTYEQVRVDPY